MLKAFQNSFKIPELKSRILFTLGLLAVFRLGSFVPVPGVDGAALSKALHDIGGGLLTFADMFTGGALSNATIFALGIMPYISASIIIQLLTAVIPYFEKLSKEGEEGRQKITQYTRYGTIGLTLVQSFGICLWLSHPGNFQGTQVVIAPGWGFNLMAMMTLTTGTAFLMWLGEQITERGIGNGISLIIFGGIISSLPSALRQLAVDIRLGEIGIFSVIILFIMLVAVTGFVVLLTQATRKIPVQYSKRVVGRKVMGGQTTYLPLRVNQAGVIPIIFASSILLFPAQIATYANVEAIQVIGQYLDPGRWLYNLLYVLLIVFFSYFYTAITFNPIDMAENLKRYGGFVPGLRPGRPTAEYLDGIMTRITLPGAIALAGVAILPVIINAGMGVNFLVASFFGGTGLLIVVGVALDTVQQIEAHLAMRNYDGFFGSTGSSRIRGRRGR